MPKFFVRFGIAFLVLIAPFGVHAQREWSARADDTVAGFPTEVVITSADPLQYGIVEITAPGEYGQFREEFRSDDAGAAIVSLRQEEVERAGVYTVSVFDQDDVRVAATTFEVFPDVLDPDRSTFVLEKSVVFLGESVDGSVTLMDQYGNPLASRPVRVSVDPSADHTVTMQHDETQPDGTALFALQADETGAARVSATDLLTGESLGTQTVEVRRRGKVARTTGNRFAASLLDEFNDEDGQDQEVYAQDAARLELSIDDQSIVQVGRPLDALTIASVDADGRRTSLVGKVRIETSDTDAQVPLEPISLLPSNQGLITIALSIVFGTPGIHTLRAYVEDAPHIAGELSVFVAGSSYSVENAEIGVQSPTYVSSNPVPITISAAPYINVRVVGSYADDAGEITETVIATGDTDAEGVGAIDLSLDMSVMEHVLQVYEDGGLNRFSQPFTIRVDDTAPEVLDITLAEDTVAPLHRLAVTARAESDLTVALRIDGKTETVSAEERPSATEGQSEYTAEIQVPEESGVYRLNVSFTDPVGNRTEQQTMFTVVKPGLAAVRNLTAEVSEDGIVVLRWDPVDGATDYHVYIGPDATNFTRTQKTGAPTSSARITGVRAGGGYAFAVTALNDDGLESEEQSNIVSITVPGSPFNVVSTPLLNSARMEWEHANGAAPGSYRIRYGVQPGVYTEQRLVEGTQRSVLLPDLINGVPYFISLSALGRDGSVMDDPIEHTVTPGQGGQPGFHAVAPDPIPQHIGTPPITPVLPTAPMPQPPPPAPVTPPSVHPSGFSVTWLLGILVVCSGGWIARIISHRRARARVISLLS